MELHPLKIRFYPKLKSGTTDICLNYELAKSSWSEKDQSLKGKHKDIGYVLNLTNQHRHKVQEIYQQLIQRNLHCDVNIIRQKLTGNKSDPAYQCTLFSLFDRIINRKGIV